MWFHKLLLRPLSKSRPLTRFRILPLTKSFSSFRSSNILQLSRRLQSRGLRRLYSTARVITKETSSPLLYPERLLVYHAGTGRIIFLGIWKLTTFFILAFFCVRVVPTLLSNPDQPNWKAAVALLFGALPFIFTTILTTPFVAFIHLRLPLYARKSTDLLHRYSATLSPGSELDITRMTIFGRQQIFHIPIANLYPAEAPLGIANLRRKVTRTKVKKRWWVRWLLDPPMTFWVERKGKSVVEKEIWEGVERALFMKKVKPVTGKGK